MKRDLIDSIIEKIAKNISKEVIPRAINIEEYLFNQIRFAIQYKNQPITATILRHGHFANLILKS